MVHPVVKDYLDGGCEEGKGSEEEGDRAMHSKSCWIFRAMEQWRDRAKTTRKVC